MIAKCLVTHHNCFCSVIIIQLWKTYFPFFNLKYFEVLQNIQDVTYNCKDLQLGKDELEAATTLTPHECDNRMASKKKVQEDTVPFDELELILNNLADGNIRSVHPTHRSLSVIADREDIARQDVPFSEDFVNSNLHCISDIPQYIIDDLNGTNTQDCATSQRVHQLDEQRKCSMVIEILYNVLSDHSIDGNANELEEVNRNDDYLDY